MNEQDNQYLGELIKSIVDASELDVKEDAVKARIDEMYDYYEQQDAQYGMNMNSYLAMQNMSVEDLRNQLADQAYASVKGDVLFEEIAKAENITVEDAEVDHELQLYKEYYNIPEDEFAKFAEERREDICQEIFRRKVGLFLLENNN